MRALSILTDSTANCGPDRLSFVLGAVCVVLAGWIVYTRTSTRR